MKKPVNLWVFVSTCLMNVVYPIDSHYQGTFYGFIFSDDSITGKLALVKAKTGTGKTATFLARYKSCFLINELVDSLFFLPLLLLKTQFPVIEGVLKAASTSTVKWGPKIFVLFLCPTRELASQLAAEANALLKYHDGKGIQTLVGGTHFKVYQERLESDQCLVGLSFYNLHLIIVATPGRFVDHVENKSTLSVLLMGLKMLILDEADHLLDLDSVNMLRKLWIVCPIKAVIVIICNNSERGSLNISACFEKGTCLR